MFYIIFFIFGLIIGSFLNVVILRLNKKSLKGRSYCVYCKKKLSWYELIPLISFLIQKGKCRKCGKEISLQYPLVEFFTGLIFTLIAIKLFFFSLFIMFFWFVIAGFLIVIFVYDLKYSLVADKIIYPAIILGLIYIIFLYFIGSSLIFQYLLSGLIGGIFFLIIVLISREKWMGIGDIKIGIFMGLVLGLSNLFIALFLAFIVGAIVSVILLIFKKKGLKSEIPFGPFLTGATLVAFLWGEYLLFWYLNLFI